MNKIALRLMELSIAICLSFAIFAGAAKAEPQSDVVAAVNNLYASLSNGNSAGFARYLVPTGFSEFNPDWDGLRQLDMNVFEEIFKSGAKIDVHVADLKVREFGDIALATGFRVGSITPPGGKPIASRLALTMIWSKIKGDWKLSHVHLSTALANPQ